MSHCVEEFPGLSHWWIFVPSATEQFVIEYFVMGSTNNTKHVHTPLCFLLPAALRYFPCANFDSIVKCPPCLWIFHLISAPPCMCHWMMFAPADIHTHNTCTHLRGTKTGERHEVRMHVLAKKIKLHSSMMWRLCNAPQKACAQTVVFCRTTHVKTFVALHVRDVERVSAGLTDVPLRLEVIGIVPQLCKCGKGKHVCAANLFWRALA